MNLRELDGKQLVAALGEIAPPLAAETERELIAVAYGHEDAAIRKKAMAVVDKHVAAAKQIRAVLKPAFRAADEGDAVARLRALKRKDVGQLASALVRRGANGYGVAFEDDPSFARDFVYQLLRPDENTLNLHESKHRPGEFTFVETSTIPEVVFDELPKLRHKLAFDHLYLGGELKTLPPRFREFAPFLKRLTLYYVDMAELPEVLFECSKLEELTIIGFNLTAIPDSIGTLKELRSLTIHECKKVKALPDAIAKLPKPSA